MCNRVYPTSDTVPKFALNIAPAKIGRQALKRSWTILAAFPMMLTYFYHLTRYRRINLAPLFQLHRLHPDLQWFYQEVSQILRPLLQASQDAKLCLKAQRRQYPQIPSCFTWPVHLLSPIKCLTWFKTDCHDIFMDASEQRCVHLLFMFTKSATDSKRKFEVEWDSFPTRVPNSSTSEWISTLFAACYF